MLVDWSIYDNNYTKVIYLQKNNLTSYFFENI